MSEGATDKSSVPTDNTPPDGVAVDLAKRPLSRAAVEIGHVAPRVVLSIAHQESLVHCRLNHPLERDAAEPWLFLEGTADIGVDAGELDLVEVDVAVRVDGEHVIWNATVID